MGKITRPPRAREKRAAKQKRSLLAPFRSLVARCLLPFGSLLPPIFSQNTLGFLLLPFGPPPWASLDAFGSFASPCWLPFGSLWVAFWCPLLAKSVVLASLRSETRFVRHVGGFVPPAPGCRVERNPK